MMAHHELDACCASLTAQILALEATVKAED